MKTKKTEESVDAFLNGIADEQRRKDVIVGLGQRTLRYPGGRELDWFASGFSPRKEALTLHESSCF